MRFARFGSAAFLGTALALAACSGGDAGGPPKVSQVVVTALTPQIEVGATTQFTAVTRDAKGNTLVGRPVTWSASPTTVATVDANGVVTGVGAGSATVTAAAEGASGSQAIAVVPVPVALVFIENRTPSVRQGEATQLTAIAQDAIGRPLTGRQLTWSTSNAAVATVSTTGLVTGASAGSAFIAVASEGKRDSVLVRVRSLQAPSISSTTPATWLPGGQATIAGSNFAPDVASNEVFVGGTRATVTAATPTSLTLTIPAATALPCTPTGPIPVVVSVNGDSTTGSATIAMATQRRLNVGESILLTTQSEVSCNEFAVTGGRYLVTAFNAAQTLTARASFQLVGAVKTPVTNAAVSLSVVPTAPPVTPAFGPLAQRTTHASDRVLAGHLAAMEANRQLLARKGSPRPVMRARLQRNREAWARVGVALNVVPVAPPQVGDMAWKRMMKTFNTYTSYDSVRTRVVYSGPKLVILEDTANPLANQMDAEFQRIGQEFDNTMYRYLSFFGDPLAVDSLYDNNGRVIAIFSQKVNSYTIGSGGSLLGYVTLCDFFPASDPNPSQACPPSNEGEYFYAFVPNPNATGNGAWTLERWRALVRSTLIHEMKHVVMYAERIARDANFTEDTWLEEATAQQAAELWSRDMYGGFARGADIDWARGPRCDYAQVSAACPDPFEGIMHHFTFLYRHYNSNESKSILTERGVVADPVIYGSSWSFVRWLTDVYGGADEAAFTRSLVQQQNDAGVRNVTNRTGKSWAELLGFWSLATLADNYPGGTVADARAKLPSWNTRDIFAEMSARLVSVDAQGNRNPAFPRPWPLNVRTPGFGNFPSVTRLVTSLQGGSFAAWELSGTQADPQVLGIRALNGGPPPANVGLAVVRVQ